MIRLTKPEDAAALIAVANTIGFQPNELDEFGKMLADYLGGNSDSDHFWITDDDDEDGPVGVAYYEPERMTDQTWNLQLIAIRPDHQGQGRGGKLLQYEVFQPQEARQIVHKRFVSLHTQTRKER